jgi:hypothetical protein
MPKVKAHRNARIQYVGTAYTRGKGTDTVSLHGIITDEGPDWDRPLTFKMSPDAARALAAQLIEKADKVDAEREPKAPVEFTEERPGVWKTATPEDGERLDASIDEALASLGTSLAELRAAEERDETPTVCAECDRTRPRWTMNHVGGGSWVCAPTFAMHCGVCCKPGESLTHYTEEEHRHGDAVLEHADAERAARLEASLGDTDSDELPDAQGRYCSRCHLDHTPEDCYYKV